MKQSKIIRIIAIICITITIILLGVYAMNKKEIDQDFQKNTNNVIKEDSMNIIEESRNTISNKENEIMLEGNYITNSEENKNSEDEDAEDKNNINNVQEDEVVQEQQNAQDDKEVQEQPNIQEDNTNIIEETKVEYIEGFEVSGYIKIPKYNVDAPIFKYVNKRTLEISIGISFGNLNEVGNTTLFGHAYKNMPFEQISNLENGDIIIIKDFNNREITYQVFDKQIISSQDASYMMRNTNGTREISMQTGAENNNKLIVLAREVSDN